MDGSLEKVVRYLFILAVLFILVAYYVGSTGLLKTIFSGVNTLDLTATGRTSNGVLAAYPVQH